MIERAAHLAPLHAFKINEMSPFFGTAADVSHECLRGAHALTIMLASAFVDCPDTAGTNPHVIHDALEGIGHLIALASFATDGAQYMPEASS